MKPRYGLGEQEFAPSESLVKMVLGGQGAEDAVEQMGREVGRRTRRYMRTLAHRTTYLGEETEKEVIHNGYFINEIRDGLSERLFPHASDSFLENLAQEFFAWAEKNPQDPAGWHYLINGMSLSLDVTELKKKKGAVQEQIDAGAASWEQAGDIKIDKYD